MFEKHLWKSGILGKDAGIQFSSNRPVCENNVESLPLREFKTAIPQQLLLQLLRVQS